MMSDIPTIRIQNEEPPCPRVNTWAEGYPPSEFLVTPGSYVFSQPEDSPASGIDIFFWNESSTEFHPQDVEVTATGNPEIIIQPAGALGDQTQYQLRYTEPGIYAITIRIFNK